MKTLRTVGALLALSVALSGFADTYVCDFSHGIGSLAVAPENVAVGDVMNLTLPDDVTFSLKITAAPPAGIAGQSFIAKDVLSSASAVVKPLADGIRITIDDFENLRTFNLRIKDGVASCSMRDTSGSHSDTCATCDAPPPLSEPSPNDPSSSNSSPNDPTAAIPSHKALTASIPASKALTAKLRLADANAFPIASHPAVIDVLVAFDQGAKAWAANSWVNEEWHNEGTIQEFAAYAVDKMNTVLEKSQLLDKFSYRLVGVVEVDASYDVINNDLLNALRLRNSGALANVGAARERCGADTITLLIDRNRDKSTTAGLGYKYKTQWTAQSFDSTGYTCNICDIKTVVERYTMSHEQGHNLGCGHSNQQGSNSGPGRYSYSCGYHFQDASGTNRYTIMAYAYTSPASGEYYPVPYFSTPEITPPDLGVPVGTVHSNDNRRTILQTYNDASNWREHVLPYDWDVLFLDDNGNELPEEVYFSYPFFVTLTNSNPNATIYYTYDGSVPGPSSYNCGNGHRFTIGESKTITASVVIDGVAQSIRTIRLIEGLLWAGGETDGTGEWSTNTTDRPWNAYNGTTLIYEDRLSSVAFPDLSTISSASVSVKGAVSPISAKFTATETAYTFLKGDDTASINIPDASFTPSGDITFNVPVKLDAVAFTNPANHSLTFNAPFGQTVSATSGYCTNTIGIGAYGTLTISPGTGNTQTFDHFSNGSWFYSNARINVGSGTVVFKGPASDKGLYGSPQFNVDRDANVILDMTSSAYDPFYSNSNVSGEGTITYKAVLPSNPSHWTSTGWKGTIAFEGITADNTTKDFQFENYGNANSKVLLRNCAILYLKNNNATFPGTLVLDGEGALRLGNNGYSNNYNTFGALEGNGSISASSDHRQAYVFNTATNYTGSITIGGATYGRRIVFGTASDLPSQHASITVKSGALASIGSNATWYAYHGVEIAGTLIVKGASATLSCHSDGAMGVKLTDGATLRFDSANAALSCLTNFSFTSGTVSIAFAPGVSPSDKQVLVQWPDVSPAPAGNFTFTNSSFASTWELVNISTGLVVKPKNRFDVPGTSSYIAYDSALESWLDDENFWMYEDEMTWQEFMEEEGANGYFNWQNYILGLSASDPFAKVKAKISFDSEGKVVVSVADSIPRAPTVSDFTITCKLLQTNDLKNWPTEDEGTPMDGKDIAISVEGDNRFYKVLVTIQQEQ